MKIARRRALTIALGVGAAGLAGPKHGIVGQADAASGRSLKLALLGYALGIQVPTTAAFVEMLPYQPGFAAPTIHRMDSEQTVTESVISGTAELGECDPIVPMAAVEAGADLKIVGPYYLQTDLVLIVNADRIHDYTDLTKPGVVVASEHLGGLTQMLMVGPLLKRGIDFRKVQFVPIGGSDLRTRALLADRVQATLMHIDQAAPLMKQGHFKILVEPWNEYHPWINEVWITTGKWLGRKENERALVALLKQNILAFRKANTDFAWYADAYRKLVTLPHADKEQDSTLRPVWETFVKTIKPWPDDGGVTAADVAALVPIYKAVGAVKGTADPRSFVIADYAKQALREIG